MTIAALNNVTTPDNYTEAATLQCQGATRLDIDISNAAIYLQTAEDTFLHSSIGAWGPEVFYSPQFKSMPGSFAAVRVRSAVAGTPAQVTIAAD